MGQIYLLYIEKEGFWTLTPNLQQMHESLREYHHLVIRGEKNKQSFLAASTGDRNVGFCSDVGAPALYQPLRKLEYPSLLVTVHQLTLFSVA